jgi:hypothetical protein
VSSDRISESVQRDESIVRLQLQLQHVLHRCAELELQVLNSRDHALGQAAEIGGLRLRIEHHVTDDKNHRAHIARLESALADASKRAITLEAHRCELVALRASTTWKIGHSFMLPIRLLKRLARRS